MQAIEHTSAEENGVAKFNMDDYLFVDEIDNANQTTSTPTLMSIELKFITIMKHFTITPSSLTPEVVHDVSIIQSSIVVILVGVVLQLALELARSKIGTLPTPSSLPLSTKMFLSMIDATMGPFVNSQMSF